MAGKSFNDFTYGVGLNINASSFKQVKDDLKLNLDNLSKMVKSYGKILKIDPNADLSKLFDEMRRVKSIVDGINSSNNSFAGFVDKGVLGRIETLESSLKSVSSTSEEIRANLDGLKSSIVSLMEPLKAAGQIKFPATFENLFGDVKDQSSQIKNVTGTIKTIESSLIQLKRVWESVGSVDKSNTWNADSIFDWITRIDDIKDEIASMSNIDAKKLNSFIVELESIGGKLGASMKSMSPDQLKSFQLNEEYVVSEINSVISILKEKKIELEKELQSLNEVQAKFNAKNQIGSSKKSLGIQSDYTAQVKIMPKANEVEWTNKINDTITNIEGQLKPVKLTPTFSKGKNIDREVEGNLAQINHTVKVDFKVADDLDNSFEQRIKEIDNRVASAKRQVEQNAQFKIGFTYDESKSFKDAAYKIINQFKKIDTKFYIANGKKFIQDIARIRDKAKAELKDIPANIVVGNSEATFSTLETFRTDIEKKIGNIGVNLNIQNLPQFMAQAVLMRDTVEDIYNKTPIGSGFVRIGENVSAESSVQNMEHLSDAAKIAKENLDKCRQALQSLNDQGFDSPDFLKLGDIGADGKKIKGSTKKLEALLNKRRELQARLPDDIADRWQELYPEANGNKKVAIDMARKAQQELKQIEGELNVYLQKQIAYAQSRYDQAEEVLQKEKEISKVQSENTKNTVNVGGNKKLEETKNQLNSINNIIKELQTKGFKSAEFLNLGDINANGDKVEESTKRIKRLLSEYDKLQKRTTLDKGAGSNQWLDKYPKAKGDMSKVQQLIEKDEARMKKIESELNQYVQKQIAFLSSRKNSLQQILSTEEQITSEKGKQAKADSSSSSGKNANQQISMSAEEATKKVKSLNSTLAQQKKVLEDLEANKFNSKSFIRLGEWDKESGSFKKNKSEIQALVNEYTSLRDARKKAGDTKVVGREAELRGKIGAILREQKKHVSEIIGQNQKELESAKAIVAAYKESNKIKVQQTGKQSNEDIDTLTKNVENLSGKLNKAREALASLKANGLSAVSSTGLGDTKKVLKSSGVTQSLKELVALYDQLIIKKKELETSDGSSRSIANINAEIDKLMKSKELLTSKGFLGLSDTQIGDVKGRLGTDPKALNDLISQYQQLIIAKKEFEKNGDTTSDSYIQTSKALEGASQQLKILRQDQMQEIDARIQSLQTEISKRTEYIQVSQECKNIESILADVHKNQVEYAQARIALYDQELSKAQELLKVEQQRIQDAALDTNKSVVNSSNSKLVSEATETNQASGIVKLDSSTLSSLAKDGTLKSIDGKVANILSQLGSGINITGSNISIAASNVSVTGGTTGAIPGKTTQSNQPDANGQIASGAKNATDEQARLNSELVATQQNVENLSNAVQVVNERTKETIRESNTYRSSDKVDERTEKFGWVSHGKDEPPTYEHTSTVYKTNIDAYKKLYQDFIDALAKQKEIEQKIAAADGPTSKLQAELEVQKEIAASLEKQLSSHEQLYTQEAQRAAIAEATKKAQQQVKISDGSQSDKNIKKQNADLERIVDNAQKKYNEMQYTMSNFKVPMADSAVAKLREYEQLLTTLKIKQNEINQNPNLLKNEDYSQGFNSLLQQMQRVQTEFTTLQKSSEGFLSKIKNLNDIKTLGTTFDPNNLGQMHSAMQDFANSTGLGSARLIEFNDAQRTATFEINNGKGQVQQLTVEYDAATNSLGRYISKTREIKSETQKFLESLKGSFKNVARYMTSFGSIYRIFAVIRQGFTYIRDIDSALTELKKVTDETSKSYNQFLQDMSKTGSVVGATVKDLTTMAAEWARLGYSMKEAGKLAESTAILLNVSEFDDATKASEALISTMQAFQYTAEESGHVVDILNEIGNNYAISSDGIATALQDSASALMEGGNNLEQAVALVAAANKVVQDPNSVGSALRTISLRLRGTSVKILEEMGEETEGVVESVSKLQGKIKALSGVDILTNAGDYKDTYTILKEIGTVWEDMSDIDQAALLELMAGKNRANTLSAILSNMEDLEGAYNDALNAEGSALKENEAYLDSIQGRVDLFNNAVQTLWMNLIDSETVKNFVSFGTNVIKFLDTVPGKITAVVSALALIAKFKGFSLLGLGKDMIGGLGKVTSAFTTLQSLSSTMPVGATMPTASIQAYAAAVANLTAKQQANMLASQGLSQAQIQLAMQHNSVGDAAIREATSHIITKQASDQEAVSDQQLAANKILLSAASLKLKGDTDSLAAAEFLEANASKLASAEDAKQIILASSLSAAQKAAALSALGLTGANMGLAASFKALFASNPVGMIITIATTILSIAIPIIEKLHKSAEEVKEEVEELTTTYENAKKTFSDNIEILTTSGDKKTYATLEEEFATLAAGVDKYGNNISLTSDQYERYKEICEQIVGINPSIAAGYDSATRAIGNNVSILERLIELQKEQQRNNVKEYISNENLSTMTENAVNDYKDFVKSINPENYNIGFSGVKIIDGEAQSGFINQIDKYMVRATGIVKDEWDSIPDYIEKNYDIIREKIPDILAIAGEDFIDDNGQVWQALDDSQLDDLYDFLNDATSNIKEYKDGLVDTLLQVPFSSRDYDKLTQSSRGFITEWIKNAGQFKVDKNTTPEEVQQYRDTILQLVNDISDENLKINYEGDTFTAQELLDQIYNLDPSTVNWTQYQNKMYVLRNTFFEAIGGADNEYGITLDDLRVTFGIDFFEKEDEKGGEYEQTREQVGEMIGKTASELQAWLNTLPAEKVIRFYEIEWNKVDNSNVNDFGDVEGVIDGASDTIIPKTNLAQTYSALSSSAEEFNSIQQQTDEILHSGIEVTQEYKDALLELGISEEELKECFDETNPLMVKNASALKELVEESKDSVAQNVKMAKSHARLKYLRLAKELNEICGSTEDLTSAQKLAASVILDQMDTVETAIYKYTLLEDKLLGTHNAFEKFNEGKEVDSLETYSDSYVEMAQTIYDAYYKTGEVGTEAVNAAVEAMIDPKKLAGLERGTDAYNQKVFEIFSNEILPTFTLDGDSISLDIDSMSNFIHSGMNKIFDGTGPKDFSLKDKIMIDGEEVATNLESVAKAMGMTETQAYAMFAALKRYTGKDYLSMLDDSTEGQIMNTTQKLTELNKQKLELLADGGYEENKAAIDALNEKILELTANLAELRTKAKGDLIEYENNEDIIAKLGELGDLAKLTGKDLADIGFTSDQKEKFETEMGLTFDEASAEEIFAWIIKRQEEIGEPTVVTVQYAIEKNEAEISGLQKDIDALRLDWNDAMDSGEFHIAADISSKIAEIQQQIDGLELQNEEWAITYNITNEDTVLESLQTIDGITIGNKTFNVICNDEATSKLRMALNLIRELKDTALDLGLTISGRAGANGTAHVLGTALKSGSWGAPRTETALVGELGPELLVRGNRWTTIGENGAEFTNIRKGDIIFNHKQTEDLLSKGYISGRGRMAGGAFASGTAYNEALWYPVVKDNEGSSSDGSLSGSKDDEFEEIFDWFEVLLEEINEQLDLMNAKLENAVGIGAKGSLIDQLLNTNHYKIYELAEGIKLYTDYAAKLLQKVPAQYRVMAQDGSVAITEFLGEANEETVEAINNYREWAQKVADLNQQLEETKTEIADLAKQKFDIVVDEYDNIISILEAQRDQFDAQISLMEDRGYVAAKVYYESMIQNTRKQSGELEKQKKAMQAVLDEQVRLGNIKVGSEQWYEMIEALYDVDSSIKDCVTDLEEYQNALNDIHWENFENLTNRLDYLKEETQSLIDLMDSEYMVITPETDDGWSADQVEWSREGMASLGLYAQQMEIAEYTARQYAEAIDDLNADFKAGKYSESEYQEKLEELTSAQYDSIEAYYDAQEAIKDLHKTRVDSIKEGIEKEIEAYEKLIQKKKEELDADKDLYDFEKSVADQQKNISDIERKLAALSVDNSMSAMAKRKQLEAELAEARASLEESYHDRSVTDQQNALDKELENYKEEKDAEIEKLEEYLEDVKTIVADSLVIIQDNASGIYETLNSKANEYNLTLSDSIVSPWRDGELAVSDYQTAFDTAMSSTTNQLEAMKRKWQELIDKMAKAAQTEINSQQKENNRYVEATPVPTVSNNTTSKAIAVGGKINAGSAPIYADSHGSGASSQYYSSDPIYTVLEEQGGYVLVRHHSLTSGYSGWFKKSDVKGYAKGTTGTKSNELAWIDELGDELVMHADGSGRLSFLSKGTAVIPHDISENLMELGQLDPSDVLSRNTPIISMSPSAVTNNMEVNMSIAEVVHIDTVSNETIPDLTRAIEKQMDKYMKNINNNIRKYAR